MITGCAILGAILRFEKRLERLEGGCRMWTGAQTRGGKGRGPRGGKARGRKKSRGGPYGRFWVGPDKKDTVTAHVFAAFLAGKIKRLRVPETMHLDHHCQNGGGTLCVDCTELVHYRVNLERRLQRPIPKVHRLPPSKLKRRSRGTQRGPGNSKKFRSQQNSSCASREGL